MSNIKTGEKHIWEDVSVVSVGKEPGHSLELPYFNKDAAIARGQSPYKLSLNGQWEFYWQKGSTGLPQGYESAEYSSADWEKITVPGVWQFQGYGQPFYYASSYPQAIGTDKKTMPCISHGLQEIGLYRKSFILPENFDGREIFLHFGALKAAAEITVNGHYVGYTQGSMTPHEFRVTAHLHPGENTLTATVYRYSVGTYFEDQDMWFLSGIYREVYLYAEPKLALRDIHASANLDEKYENATLTVSLSFKNYNKEAAGTVRVTLPESGQLIGEQSIENHVSFVAEITSPEKWSHETPRLYDLLVEITVDGITEYKALRIGFKKVEIIGNVLLLNGKRLLLRGVNRHDYHPETGWAVPYDTYIQDLTYMKQWNINAIRTSHYPNDPLLYDLCDEWGILIMDECDMETHGARTKNIPGSDPRWMPHVLDRMRRMVLRDRNHACIFMWSLGNEAGTGTNFFGMKKAAQELDSTRPVHYEGYIHKKATDVISKMYPSGTDTLMMAEKKSPGSGLYGAFNRLVTSASPIPANYFETMPVLFCEYAHSMENSLGNFKEHMDIMESHNNMAGAFIWDFVDQAILKTTPDGPQWLYGTDFKEVFDSENGLKSKGSTGSNAFFCANGIIGADRTPHPAAVEVKKVYQCISVKEIDTQNGLFLLQNRQMYKDLSEYTLKWKIERAGECLQSGEVDCDTFVLPPQNEVEIALPIKLDSLPADDLVCTLEFAQKADTLWAMAGYIQAAEQFRISSYTPDLSTKAQGQISAVQEGKLITITGENFEYKWLDGILSSIIKYGKEYLTSPVVPNYFRALIDNDFGAFNFKPELMHLAGGYAYLKAQEHQLVHSVMFNASALSVVTTWKISGFSNVVTICTVTGDGDIEVYHQATPTKNSAVRVGLKFSIPAEFSTVDWVGRGPEENYCDRKTGSPVGHYTKPLCAFEHRYMRPQENGHRCDVTRLSICSPGETITVTALEECGFECNVLPYSGECLEKAAHIHELFHGDTHVFIDAAMRGVGGDVPGMLMLRDEYKLKKGTPYSCHVRLIF